MRIMHARNVSKYVATVSFILSRGVTAKTCATEISKRREREKPASGLESGI